MKNPKIALKNLKIRKIAQKPQKNQEIAVNR